MSVNHHQLPHNLITFFSTEEVDFKMLRQGRHPSNDGQSQYKLHALSLCKGLGYALLDPVDASADPQESLRHQRLRGISDFAKFGKRWNTKLEEQIAALQSASWIEEAACQHRWGNSEDVLRTDSTIVTVWPCIGTRSALPGVFRSGLPNTTRTKERQVPCWSIIAGIAEGDIKEAGADMLRTWETKVRKSSQTCPRDYMRAVAYSVDGVANEQTVSSFTRAITGYLASHDTAKLLVLNAYKGRNRGVVWAGKKPCLEGALQYIYDIRLAEYKELFANFRDSTAQHSESLTLLNTRFQETFKSSHSVQNSKKKHRACEDSQNKTLLDRIKSCLFLTRKEALPEDVRAPILRDEDDIEEEEKDTYDRNDILSAMHKLVHSHSFNTRSTSPSINVREYYDILASFLPEVSENDEKALNIVIHYYSNCLAVPLGRVRRSLGVAVVNQQWTGSYSVSTAMKQLDRALSKLLTEIPQKIKDSDIEDKQLKDDMIKFLPLILTKALEAELYAFTTIRPGNRCTFNGAEGLADLGNCMVSDGVGKQFWRLVAHATQVNVAWFSSDNDICGIYLDDRRRLALVRQFPDQDFVPTGAVANRKDGEIPTIPKHVTQ
eukprot:Protomagalhaensia_sp_Gyna_25__4927@NODE_52_length_6070_cov_248_257005_g39_i0_p1_GENE_NODE_52_length_6070_cov_248_257005_g39_i0NODE_52_length_6070_cov_248_257005_g39_i0_p1_ORF_typecomplete_len606_score68_13Urb2/PF10441_9/0_11Importin_rep_6/PF18829_1/4_7e02Importin_rep_6/PF18829_1/4_5Importin_rep_6/PF18829_1/6_8e02_NODE_52_length_6070_cov_248_257005_g39_i01061923